MEKNIDLVLNQFNSRECAILLWWVVFLIFILFKNNVRNSFKEIFSKFLFQILFITISYNVLITYFLYKVWFWNIDFLKESLYWFLWSSLALIINIKEIDKWKDKMKNMIISSFSITAILWFVWNIYPFSFYTELILQPILILIFALITFAELQLDKKSEYKTIVKFLKWVLWLFGFVFIVYLFTSLSENYTLLFNVKNIYFLLFPLVYFVLYYPFLYILRLLMNYESLFIRINIKNSLRIKDFLYVKYKIFMFCWLNLFKLNEFSTWRSFYMENKEDIEKIIFDFTTHKDFNLNGKPI